MDTFVDVIFWVLLIYAMFGLFDLLDDIQRSPQWVEGGWKYED